MYCQFFNKWVPRNSRTCVLIHTGDKPYECELCNYTTTERQALQKHVLIHTGDKPYACDECSYSATQKQHLKRHKLRHTRVKSFKCHLCEFSCTKSRSLEKHKIAHVKPRPILPRINCFTETANFMSGINVTLLVPPIPQISDVSNHTQGYPVETGIIAIVISATSEKNMEAHTWGKNLYIQ